MSGLILARRVGQSLYIGNARVKVIGLDRNRVELLIEAPDDVIILREELIGRAPTSAASSQ